ncbi:unnamed protein product [Victoria cruziana]
MEVCLTSTLAEVFSQACIFWTFALNQFWCQIIKEIAVSVKIKTSFRNLFLFQIFNQSFGREKTKETIYYNVNMRKKLYIEMMGLLLNFCSQLAEIPVVLWASIPMFAWKKDSFQIGKKTLKKASRRFLHEQN